jgi:hypothetical protein
MANLKITWTVDQGWIVFDRAAWGTHTTQGNASLPALFVAGDDDGASRRCSEWIDRQATA